MKKVWSDKNVKSFVQKCEDLVQDELSTLRNQAKRREPPQPLCAKTSIIRALIAI